MERKIEIELRGSLGMRVLPPDADVRCVLCWDNLAEAIAVALALYPSNDRTDWEANATVRVRFEAIGVGDE